MELGKHGAYHCDETLQTGRTQGLNLTKTQPGDDAKFDASPHSPLIIEFMLQRPW